MIVRFRDPNHVQPMEKKAIYALREADLIVLGPGSSYTSVISGYVSMVFQMR